jgi:hypothetical protein
MARLGRSGTLVRLSRCASAPAFSVAVVLLLGVCAGAVGLVSGVARDLLLRRLPYPDPDRLVVLKQVPPRSGVVEDLRAAALFDSVEAYAERAANIGTPGQVERALIARVTSGFLSLSTGSPRLGRPLLSHDFSYSATPVALITHDVWRHRYGATPDVLGATVAIDGQLHDIVGVLPEEFRTVEELALAGTIADRAETSLGFRADGVLTAEISLNRAKYLTDADRFFTDLLNRLSGAPGLRDLALVSNVPAGTVFGGGLIKIHGRAEWVDAAQVSSGYFSLLGIPVVNGRSFDETDTATSPRVTVVNETFARHYWDDPMHALGRVFAHGELSRTNSARTVTVVEDVEWTVVGVVSDVGDGAFGATPRPKFYTNYLQNLHGAGRSQMTILARASRGDGSALAPSLLQAARSVDPDQPLYNVLPLTRILSSRWAAERALTSVMSAFALVALIVAALGVYAAASAAAAKGRREVGIRLALGGSRTAVLRALLGREGKAVLLGLWFGALAGFLGVSTLRALVSVSTDLSVASVAGAVLFVAVVTAIALVVPAWRATQLDPSVVLRVS